MVQLKDGTLRARAGAAPLKFQLWIAFTWKSASVWTHSARRAGAAPLKPNVGGAGGQGRSSFHSRARAGAAPLKSGSQRMQAGASISHRHSALQRGRGPVEAAKMLAEGRKMTKHSAPARARPR